MRLLLAILAAWFALLIASGMNLALPFVLLAAVVAGGLCVLSTRGRA